MCGAGEVPIHRIDVVPRGSTHERNRLKIPDFGCVLDRYLSSKGCERKTKDLQLRAADSFKIKVRIS